MADRSRRSWLCASAAVLLATQLGCSALGLGSPPPAWELPPPPAPEAPVVQEGTLSEAEFDNGLRVVVMEDHRLPRVSVGVMAKRGAGIVDPSRAGAASLMSEVMKRGAGDLDALALARSVEDMGASLSVGSGWDSTMVGVSGLSRDLDALMDILADATLRPRFDPSEVAKAQSEQLAAIEQAVDDPGTLVAWHAARALYGDHPYGVPSVGTEATVAVLDAGHLRSLYDRIFVPNAAILFASGDVNAEAFIARARELFGEAAWPRGEVAPAAPPPPAQVPAATRVVIVDKPDAVQARIMVLHEGIARDENERVATDLMNKVLGGSGFASRLMQRLRSDEGLTYSVWSGYSLRRQPGPFQVATFTRVEETRKAVDIVLDEMRRIREEPPSELELQNASSLALGRFGLGLETPEAVLASLINLDLYGLPADALDTYRSRVRAVSLDDVSRAANERIHPDRVVIVVLGPAAALSEQLAGLGPIEVVEP